MTRNNHILPDDFDWDTYLESTAQLLNIELTDLTYPGVKTNLQSTYKIAESLLSLELPRDIESPAIFRP